MADHRRDRQRSEALQELNPLLGRTAATMSALHGLSLRSLQDLRFCCWLSSASRAFMPLLLGLLIILFRSRCRVWGYRLCQRVESSKIDGENEVISCQSSTKYTGWNGQCFRDSHVIDSSPYVTSGQRTSHPPPSISQPGSKREEEHGHVGAHNGGCSSQQECQQQPACLCQHPPEISREQEHGDREGQKELVHHVHLLGPRRQNTDVRQQHA
mmetsp:Transcript_21116/g.58626  ORF Transcript_21116/g.58626 Transcript_21116/m.58626 type:complete len:213 (-) Transcript_21116:445-1083(-)